MIHRCDLLGQRDSQFMLQRCANRLDMMEANGKCFGQTNVQFVQTFPLSFVVRVDRLEQIVDHRVQMR